MANKLRQIGLNVELSGIATRILVLNARIATERNKNKVAGLELERLELRNKEVSLRNELASLTDFEETDTELRDMQNMVEGRK